MASQRGFKLLTKARRREISRKGGAKSHELGNAYKFTSDSGRTAGAQGLATRLRRAAHTAAFRLMKMGFTADQLYQLGLTEQEFVYYGGSRARVRQIRELRDRIVQYYKDHPDLVPSTEGEES